MAAYTEIYLEQYADYSTKINLSDNQGGNINLSNYTASSQMRKSYYSSTAASFNVAISNASTGELTVSMSSAATGNLTPGRYVYDVVIKDSSNVATRVVEGIAVVLPGVTHA